MPPPPYVRPPLTHFLCLPLNTPQSSPQLRVALRALAIDDDYHDGAVEAALDGDAKEGEKARQQKGSHQADNHSPSSGAHIPRGAIRPSGAIHLTVGVMSLQTAESIANACRTLQELNARDMIRTAWHDSTRSDSTPTDATRSADSTYQTLSGPSPSSSSTPDAALPPISLISLHAMHQPNHTSVLYAAPQPQQPLQAFVQQLHNVFENAGLLVGWTPSSSHGKSGGGGGGGVKYLTARQKKHGAGTSSQSGSSNISEEKVSTRAPVKLHATIVNTIYAPRTSHQVDPARRDEKTRGARKSDHRSRRRGPRIFIDARDLLSRHQDTVWARDFKLDRVAICEMGARKVWKSGREDTERKRGRQTASLGDEAEEAGNREEETDMLDGVEDDEVIDEVYKEICTIPLPY